MRKSFYFLALCLNALLLGCHAMGRQSAAPPPRSSDQAARSQSEAKAQATRWQEIQESVLKPEPVPNGNQPAADFQARIVPLGNRLITAAGKASVTFRFECLRDDHPRIYHAGTGHIFVTQGTLRTITDDDELAALLAIEMAEVMAENRVIRAVNDTPSLPSTGIDDQFRAQALAAKTPGNNPADVVLPPTQKEIDKIATRLLSKSGFRGAQVAAVRSKFANVIAETPAPQQLSAN